MQSHQFLQQLRKNTATISHSEDFTTRPSSGEQMERRTDATKNIISPALWPIIKLNETKINKNRQINRYGTFINNSKINLQHNIQ